MKSSNYIRSLTTSVTDDPGGGPQSIVKPCLMWHPAAESTAHFRQGSSWNTLSGKNTSDVHQLAASAYMNRRAICDVFARRSVLLWLCPCGMCAVMLTSHGQQHAKTLRSDRFHGRDDDDQLRALRHHVNYA